MSEHEQTHEREHDDSNDLDGRPAAYIFDLSDVFDTEANDAVADGIKDAAPKEDDDGYEADDALGKGDPNGPLIRYSGQDWIVGLTTREDIVAASDVDAAGKKGGMTTKILGHIADNKPVLFMPTDVEDRIEYQGGRQVYVMKLHGSLMNGSKAEVTITDVDVFFDVRIPDRPPAASLLSKAGQAKLAGMEGDRLAQFGASLKSIVADAGAPDARIENTNAFPNVGYSVDTKAFKRVHVSNLQQRKKAIAAVRAQGYQTMSDDRTCYYRKAAREYGLPLSSWAILSNYEHCPGFTDRSPLAAHIFRVPVANYRPQLDTMASKEKRDAAAKAVAANPLLAKDRTLVLGWDIESYSKRGTGDLPRGEHDEDNAFMICMSAHWKDDTTPLAQIVLVDVETAPDSRWTTVVCGSPKNVLKAFALCWKALAPDIVTGFNDSEYDWPFVAEKARKLGILGWMYNQMSASPWRNTTDESVMRWNYAREKRIKITADENFLSSYLKVPGCVPIDTRVCFKKLYPKSETPKAGGSLKFYLKISDLPSKADMPIKRMWRIYEAALESEGEPDPTTAEEMRHVAHYCVIDAFRCQQLLVRRNVINDYREVSTLAFVSLFDSHYYAGGMKVCNLLAAYAWRRNILVSMIPLERMESGKYPGAYVFPPEKGVVPDPAHMEAVEIAAAELRAALEAETAGEPGAAKRVAEAKVVLLRAFNAFASDRPVTGLDFASLYPSLIMAYNLSPEKILLTEEEANYWRSQGRKLHEIDFQFNGRTIRGWSVLHENKPEEIGLYPTVLIDLFNKRAEVKGVLGTHGAVKELIEIINARATKNAIEAAMTRGLTKEAAEKETARRGATASEVVIAANAILDEALAAKARTDAALAPDAPPPRISPGSTLVEEIADLKRLGKNANGQIEGIRRLFKLATVNGTIAEPTDAQIRAAIVAEYDRACFDWTCANTKQGALKVYMNTFYGEAGNSLSPFFMLHLAGGVTSAGQFNIKLVADFVRSKGFRIKYGDTDSLYLQPPDSVFAECDENYALGKLTREEYFSAMVRITMRALNQVRDDVNAMLLANNGTKYLKMAYEEVLYPVVFTGKKKYFGVPHLNEVNFHPEKLFIKGIDVVKQGQPGLAIEIGKRVMWACMSIDNKLSLRAVVEEKLRDAVVNGEQWNFEHFIKTDAWKPNKNNVAVHRFIARMRVRHAAEKAENERIVAAGGQPKPYMYELPEPGERFSYIIAKTGAAFDLQGRKSTMRKGDRMEFSKNARELGHEVDVAFYMISYIVGLCARFINGEAQFAPPGNNLEDKKIDELSQKAAKKYLENFIKGLSNLDSTMMRKRGFAYRRAFNAAAKVARGALIERVGANAAEVLHGSWLSYEFFDDEAGGDDDDEATVDNVSAMVNNVWKSATDFAASTIAADGPVWCRELGLEMGIEANGSDSRPTSPGPEVAAPAAPVAPKPLVTTKKLSAVPTMTAKAAAAAAAAPRAAPIAKVASTNAKAAPASAKAMPAATIVKTTATSAKAAPAKAAPATKLFKTPTGLAANRRRNRGPAMESFVSSSIDRLEASTRARMAEAMPVVGEIAMRYEADLSRLVHETRVLEHRSHPEIGTGDGAPYLKKDENTPPTQYGLVGITEADEKALSDFRRIWFDAVGIQMSRQRNVQFTQHLARLKDKRLGATAAPPKGGRDKIIAAAAAKMRTSGELDFADM